jgi:hypothetical protein
MLLYDDYSWINDMLIQKDRKNKISIKENKENKTHNTPYIYKCSISVWSFFEGLDIQ